MTGTAFDQAPDPGHNSRHFDVERTAVELSKESLWRAEFYRVHAGSKASRKQLLDAYSIIDPDVSDAEYRLMRFRLYYCNEACDNYFGSTELEAALLKRSDAAIERASKGLEHSQHQENYQVSRRRRNQSSIRSFEVPDCKRQAVEELLALLEPAKMRLQEPLQMRVETPEPANLQSRTRKNEGITLVNNSNKKNRRKCAEELPEEERGVDKVIEAYNDNAREMGWVQELKTPPAKRGWIRSRVKQFDGVSNILLALSVAAEEPYLRKLGSEMSLDYLLKTNGKDWLALLFNKAMSRRGSAQLEAPDAAFRRFLETSAGKELKRTSGEAKAREVFDKTWSGHA